VEKRKFLTLTGLELRPLGLPAVASRYTPILTVAFLPDRNQNEVASHRTKSERVTPFRMEHRAV
jgi:hypothetical protein